MNDSKYCVSRGSAHWVSAESIEITPAAQNSGDLRCRHHRSKRDAVSDPLRNVAKIQIIIHDDQMMHESRIVISHLGHGDDVRYDTMGLEAPEMGSGTSKTGLDFIGDANSSSSPHGIVHGR